MSSYKNCNFLLKRTCLWKICSWFRYWIQQVWFELFDAIISKIICVIQTNLWYFVLSCDWWYKASGITCSEWIINTPIKLPKLKGVHKEHSYLEPGHTMANFRCSIDVSRSWVDHSRRQSWTHNNNGTIRLWLVAVLVAVAKHKYTHQLRSDNFVSIKGMIRRWDATSQTFDNDSSTLPANDGNFYRSLTTPVSGHILSVKWVNYNTTIVNSEKLPVWPGS